VSNHGCAERLITLIGLVMNPSLTPYTYVRMSMIPLFSVICLVTTELACTVALFELVYHCCQWQRCEMGLGVHITQFVCAATQCFV